MITLDELCSAVRRRMSYGRVIPFLGAGVGRVGRPDSDVWHPPDQFTPTGQELADSLAASYGYPSKVVEPNRELSRIAQWAEFSDGQAGVGDQLTAIFSHKFPPTPVHECLALESREAADRGVQPPFPVLMTTNYDDSLERAFDARSVAHDVLVYQDRRLRPGLWVHQRDGQSTEIGPDTDDLLDPPQRPVILKFHGGIDRADRDRASFVISDSDYAGYPAGVLTTLPASVGKSISLSSLLFLGYGLNDWNLRVFLFTVWRQQQYRKQVNSWAVELKPQDYDVRFWSRFSVQLVKADLQKWVDAMDRTRP